MNGRRRALALTALCAAGCALAPVQAGPPSQAAPRPSVTSADSGLTPSAALSAGLTRWLGTPQLQGQANFRYFGFSVYQAQLWVAPGKGDPAQAWAQQPVVLSLRYQRALPGPAIAQRSIEEMRRHPSMPEAAAATWLAQLQTLLTDVREGERLIGVYDPAKACKCGMRVPSCAPWAPPPTPCWRGFSWAFGSTRQPLRPKCASNCWAWPNRDDRALAIGPRRSGALGRDGFPPGLCRPAFVRGAASPLCQHLRPAAVVDRRFAAGRALGRRLHRPLVGALYRRLVCPSQHPGIGLGTRVQRVVERGLGAAVFSTRGLARARFAGGLDGCGQPGFGGLLPGPEHLEFGPPILGGAARRQ